MGCKIAVFMTQSTQASCLVSRSRHVRGQKTSPLRQLICRKAVEGSPREKGIGKDLEDGEGYSGFNKELSIQLL